MPGKGMVLTVHGNRIGIEMMKYQFEILIPGGERSFGLFQNYFILCGNIVNVSFNILCLLIVERISIIFIVSKNSFFKAAINVQDQLICFFGGVRQGSLHGQECSRFYENGKFVDGAIYNNF